MTTAVVEPDQQASAVAQALGPLIRSHNLEYARIERIIARKRSSVWSRQRARGRPKWRSAMLLRLISVVPPWNVCGTEWRTS